MADLRSYALRAEQEWSRLESGAGALELAVTKTLIERHLPSIGRILDIGGGPGRYSGWLAELGYRVTLADAVPELLEIARDRVAGLDEIVTADARDLSRWADGSFDAVLCLGPLYHLTDSVDRRRAVSEIVRVLRPGGPAAFSLITRYTHLRRVISRPAEHAEFTDPEFLRRIVEDGEFQRAAAGTFNGYAVWPAAAETEFAGSGLQTVTLAAVQGFLGDAYPVGKLERLHENQPEAYRRIFELLVDSTTDPTLLGSSTHLLYIGRRRGLGLLKGPFHDRDAENPE
ncbi:MAG TPA: class I SAM-dependent methyltransferase [Mycobacteriales bacterium]|nr:class I SAM-dependent methyltransferase [Mycobacteriales bacterium]